MSRKTDRVNHARRGVLAGAGAFGLTGMVAGAARAQAQPAGNTAAAGVSVAKRGQYATVPLRQESINVTEIQSRVRSVDVVIDHQPMIRIKD